MTAVSDVTGFDSITEGGELQTCSPGGPRFWASRFGSGVIREKGPHGKNTFLPLSSFCMAFWPGFLP